MNLSRSINNRPISKSNNPLSTYNNIVQSLKRKFKPIHVNDVRVSPDSNDFIDFQVRPSFKFLPQVVNYLFSESIHNYDQQPVFADPYSPYQRMSQVFRHAEVFEFKPFRYVDALDEAKRALDLFHQGLLKLPFKETIIKTSALDESMTSNLMFITEQKGDLVMVNPVTYQIATDRIVRLDLVFTLDPNNKEKTLQINWVNDLLPIPDEDDYRVQYAELLSSVLLTCLLILNTKGIAKQKILRKVKTKNRRLSDKDKLPDCLVTYVNTSDYMKAVTDEKKTGEKHEKRPHLRRGHIRSLPNGTKIWINDMLVKFDSPAEYIEREKYKINKQGKCLA